MTLLDLMLACKHPENHPAYEPPEPKNLKKESWWKRFLNKFKK